MFDLFVNELRDSSEAAEPWPLVGEHPGAVSFLKYSRFGCCAFECRLVFGVGGVTARRYR